MLNTWFKEHHLEPIRLLNYKVQEMTLQENGVRVDQEKRCICCSFVSFYFPIKQTLLLPQFTQRRIRITISLRHLHHRHLKVLLCDMHPLLPNGEHSGLRAHRLRPTRPVLPTLHSAPLASVSIPAIFRRSIPRIKFIRRL